MSHPYMNTSWEKAGERKKDNHFRKFSWKSKKEFPQNFPEEEKILLRSFWCIPGLGAWQPTPVFLAEESQRQRSLANYSPWDGKELDTTEATACMRTCGLPGRRLAAGLIKWQSAVILGPRENIRAGNRNVAVTLIEGNELTKRVSIKKEIWRVLFSY